jgi:conjugative transposon TraM protein
LVFYYLFTYLRTAMEPTTAPDESAFNTELPAPKLDDEYKNKLDLYMEARQDSVQRAKAARKDSLLFPAETAVQPQLSAAPEVAPERTAHRRSINYDPNERKIDAALEKLQVALARHSEVPAVPVAGESNQELPRTPRNDELAQLEQLLQTTGSGNVEDPEIKRLDGMLDKILEIQQPSRKGRSAIRMDDSTKPLIVTAISPEITNTPNVKAENGFYGIEGEVLPPNHPGNGTISAVVHANQRVRTGSKVRLRLLQDMYINNARVPANSFVHGIATVSKERVTLEIKHAVHANTVLPVRLSVFDTDGIEGISAPGADERDAGRDGLNQAVQNLELYNMDPNIGAQAAASGIQAAKTLFSKKTKTAFALLKADHKVMLVNARF